MPNTTNQSPADPAPRSMRSASVRTANLSQVLSALHFHGPLTRSDLCAYTGLTRSSVAVQVSELTDAGLVFEQAPQSDGRPGRPSPLVTFSTDIAALAIEVEVDSIAAAVFRLGGESLAERRLARTRSQVRVEDAIADIGTLARDVLADAGSPTIIGTGVGVVGLVEEAENTVTMAPNLGWDNVPLGQLLANEIKDCGEIRVGNEANLSARAESTRGAGRDANDMIYLSGEVGVGGGVISNGRPLTGRSGFAGEIGHLTVNPDGRSCGCGSIGCWETEIGIRALLERAGLNPDDGADAAETLWDHADRGEEQARDALTATGRWLGIGVSTLINIFNPDVIVLGGMYRTGYAHLIDAVRAELETRVLPPLRGAAIVPSILGDSAILIGAAEMAFEHALADPIGTMSSIRT